MNDKPASDVAKVEKATRQRVKDARRKAALKANMAKRKAAVKQRAAGQPAADNNND